MKLLIIVWGLFVASFAEDTDNSIDLNSIEVCATLNNVYRTFANIWEVYNEFKATGQLWVPVNTTACDVTPFDCTAVGPVCAVSRDNFFKTFPNRCVLEAEQNATGTEWNIVFNGICSTNPGDGFGAPKNVSLVSRDLSYDKNSYQRYEASLEPQSSPSLIAGQISAGSQSPAYTSPEQSAVSGNSIQETRPLTQSSRIISPIQVTAQNQHSQALSAQHDSSRTHSSVQESQRQQGLLQASASPSVNNAASNSASLHNNLVQKQQSASFHRAPSRTAFSHGQPTQLQPPRRYTSVQEAQSYHIPSNYYKQFLAQQANLQSALSSTHNSVQGSQSIPVKYGPQPLLSPMQSGVQSSIKQSLTIPFNNKQASLLSQAAAALKNDNSHIELEQKLPVRVSSASGHFEELQRLPNNFASSSIRAHAPPQRYNSVQESEPPPTSYAHSPVSAYYDQNSLQSQPEKGTAMSSLAHNQGLAQAQQNVAPLQNPQPLQFYQTSSPTSGNHHEYFAESQHEQNPVPANVLSNDPTSAQPSYSYTDGAVQTLVSNQGTASSADDSQSSVDYNSDTAKFNVFNDAVGSNTNTADDAQTIYNGVVYQGPYYYEPKYKHINFGNFNYLRAQSPPSLLPRPFAAQSLVSTNSGAIFPEPQNGKVNTKTYEEFLKQIPYLVSKI